MSSRGRGAEISGAHEDITLDKIKPLLEVWIQDAKQVFERLAAAHARNVQS
ncbi:hypothetical protein [Moritella marina]|uniref:hypothetical protein n=1 Tax=Moritella marina TaxID=90736 RepID=UPI00370373A1